MSLAFPPLDLPPAASKYRTVDLTEHIPGTPYRYRHGWIPRDVSIAPAAEPHPSMLAVYSGVSSDRINGALRSGNLSGTVHNESAFEAPIEAVVAGMDASMGTTQARTRVYRVVSPNVFGLPYDASHDDIAKVLGNSIGKTLTDPGYLSTTKSPGSEMDAPISIEIDVPKGTRAVDMQPYSVNTFEQEILLARGTSVQITGFRSDHRVSPNGVKRQFIVTGKVVKQRTTDLTAVHGHHVAGTPISYHHGWIPASGTDMGESKSQITGVKAVASDAAIKRESLRFQNAAQKKATAWGDPYNEGDSSDADEWLMGPVNDYRAQKFWMQYQEPDRYKRMNDLLRGPDSEKRRHVMQTVDLMFSKVGMPTTANTRLYRAIRGNDPASDKFLEAMKPGATYTERGMVSSSGQLDFTEGWLKLDAEDGYEATRPIHPDDTVIEIHPPAGTIVVGGHTDFIEVMVHPDTQFRVLSVTKVKTSKAINPIDEANHIDPFTYRRVVVEIVGQG